MIITADPAREINWFAFASFRDSNHSAYSTWVWSKLCSLHSPKSRLGKICYNEPGPGSDWTDSKIGLSIFCLWICHIVPFLHLDLLSKACVSVAHIFLDVVMHVSLALSIIIFIFYRVNHKYRVNMFVNISAGLMDFSCHRLAEWWFKHAICLQIL